MKHKILIHFCLTCQICLNLQARPSLTGLTAWAYQLQNIDISAIAVNPTFELMVMDYSADGSDETAFRRKDIQQIQNSGKTVLAYISIGEAETYRFYWQDDWDSNHNGKPDPDAPDWLGPENPEWQGNYKVRFWDPGWQAIVKQYIDKIIHQGFDGIYMDIVDAYYYWAEENGDQPDADARMVEFILDLRHYTAQCGQPDFILMPQNGEFIIEEPHVTPSMKDQYLEAIDGIGIEDIFFIGNRDNDNACKPDVERLDVLSAYQTAGKPVFSVEYLTKQDKIHQYLDLCHQYQFIPYAATRNLDTLPNGFLNTADTAVLPNQCMLLPAFPNPFNRSTVLTLQLDRPMNVGLDLFNLTGQKLQRLYHGRLTSGTHQRLLNLKNLPSGCYWVYGQAGQQVLTQKVLYIP